MEEADKSIGVGGESSSRVSAASSSSWLFASRQRFTIELRPGETTIVSWKRLIKDAQNTSPPFTAPKTEDSLDGCFKDNKSTIKQNGLLVNSDKLECLNEPVLSVAQQSRKRNKNIVKAQGEKGNDHLPSKHAKLEEGRLNFTAKNAVLEGSSALSQNLTTNSERDHKSHNLLSSPVRSSVKKAADIGNKSEHSSYTEISNNDAFISPVNSKDADKSSTATIHSRDIGNNPNSGTTNQKYLEKSYCKQIESSVRKLVTDNDEVEISTKVEQREKRETCGELPDLNLPVFPVQPEKSPSVHSKDVSNLRPKGTMLERAIRELEKVVAESRLATIEVPDVDASSAAIKRRLPREVKQKLAKVARLAQSSQGKISEELINRLMSILGHSMQLRTLKRNLKEMVLLGLSAKREKADRFQQIKMEVTEMIKLQEVLGSEGKVLLKEQYSMDHALEDKICDLYDLYVQGMDEDKGPQIRKLYVELAELWPNGIMDNHGIKNAIRRAKERRRALCDYDKVREKDRRKKSTQKMEVGVRAEASIFSQEQAVQERQTCQLSSHVLALPCRTSSFTETMDEHHDAPLEFSSISLKGSGLDNSQQEKIEKTTIPMLKEQIKQQQRELDNNRMKKLSLKLEKESRKSHKRAMEHPDAASYELAAPPSCGRPV
ncbi:Ubinuclein/Yemanuclein [Corchorus olitorius]|uniref:Ubinuclein/Yemanuclein n=1 Tax=Corchorus olitorius TaxID=93759 RepID=A0A1R3GD73_9ROSI|nr:Ubinuclein/Yemanuclein [Corchorus olitorius]